MKNFLILGLIILFLNPVTSFASKRVALVIGNSNYQSNPLKNPKNDAIDIGRILIEFNFKVIKLLDASQEEMEASIREFGSYLSPGSIGLFYYAGHGVQINGENYLIPVGSKIIKEKDVKYKAVNLGRVLDEMGNDRSGLNIVLLDACRNNPLEKSFRSDSRGLAIMQGPKGTIIGFATSPGSVASEGSGRNGIYTKHLLNNLRIKGLSIEQIFKRVMKSVDEETNGQQTPWMYSSYTGDFYFSAFEAQANKKAVELFKATESTTISAPHPHWGYEKIGVVRSINADWKYVIINLDSKTELKSGDIVKIEDIFGKLYSFKVGKINDGEMSVYHEKNHQFITVGNRIFK